MNQHQAEKIIRHILQGLNHLQNKKNLQYLSKIFGELDQCVNYPFIFSRF